LGSNGWFWYIPLENDITSVGVVADPEYLVQGRGQDLAKIFHEEIEKVEACRKRVAGATRVDKIYSILDYSYRSKSCAGDGFILIGDAYGFLDPIYSSGVLLALKMAELAADSIHEAFRSDDFSGASLGHYQAKLDQGIESMRKLVYAFYNEGFSFAQFLQKYPEQRVNIISLLMGDVFKEGVDNIYGPMADFAVIPPPLYEQLDGSPVQLKEPGTDVGEVLSAKYQYYDDAVLQEAGE
jgi:flavin-dependent dehydrogenase